MNGNDGNAIEIYLISFTIFLDTYTWRIKMDYFGFSKIGRLQYIRH